MAYTLKTTNMLQDYRLLKLLMLLMKLENQ